MSVFVDESGDFGEYEDKSPYYLVAMVFHDQNKDIYEDIKTLDRHIIELGFPIHAIHSGPIIRNESIYKDKYSDLDNRRALLNSLYNFTRKAEINYICSYIDKKDCKDSIQLNAKLSREIASNLQKHKGYLDSFEKIIVYYDNGQKTLTHILTSIFNAMFFNVEFRKVKPSDYKLFQVADLVCTWELLALKAQNKSFSESEKLFFGSEREFRRNKYKMIHKKCLD